MITFAKNTNARKMDEHTFEKRVLRKNGVEVTEYYVADSENTSDLFKIGYIENVFFEYPMSFRELHTHNFYAITWFFHGRGIIEINHTFYKIDDDTLFLISPMHFHKYEELKEQTGVVFIFSEDLLFHASPQIAHHIKYELFQRSDGVASCKVDAAAKLKLRQIADAMAMECSHGKEKFAHSQYLNTLLLQFLITLERECTWNKNFSKKSLLPSYKTYVQFRECVDNNYHSIHTVRGYAQLMGLSSMSITKHTQKFANTTPLQIIHDRVMLEARRLLRCTDFSIKEIAVHLGFKDASYFVKAFKEENQCTPVVFREQNKGKR